MAAAKNQMDEEILSESDVESIEAETDEIETEEEETAQEKKIRLAKKLIEQIERQKEEELNDKDQSATFVSRKLEEDLQNKVGKLKKEIAHQYKSGTVVRQLKGHRLAATCVALSANMKFLFTGSKDGSIIKYNFETGMKMNTIRKKLPNESKSVNPWSLDGHSDEVLALALSDDQKFLASGGRDKSIKIWNPLTCEFIYSFEGHKDTVTGLVFRSNSNQLYSCSFDRSVKIWNVDQLVYVETLFGHQDKILGIDSLNKERCVTCGARDRSLRLWKIVEESQLLFNGAHFDSIDSVALLNEETFFSGSNDSSLAVWSVMKKKPIATVKNAHKQANAGEQQQPLNNTATAAGWISAVAAFRHSDLLASGSDDGFIRLWSYSHTSIAIKEIFKIAVTGFVNELKFSPDGNYLIAAVGQEHKLGRWSTIKAAKNAALIIKLDTLKDKLNK